MRSASRPLRSPAGGPAGGFAGPFVVPGPSGVAIRARLEHLTARDEMVLRAVGAHLGALASGDLKARHAAAVADWRAGRVRVVRGGKRLARTRHHLDEAGLNEEQWRAKWEAARWFLAADGESGKRFGNETVRITPDGQISIKVPVPAG